MGKETNQAITDMDEGAKQEAEGMDEGAKQEQSVQYILPQDEGFEPSKYLIDYNLKYAGEQPILYRDSVIRQTLSCLIGKFKPNALLVGPAGVGKTKVAEDIARRIATNDSLIPDQLKGYTIWELPLTNIVSGSGLLGELERKTKNILNFAKNPKNKVILFIDEIHMIAGESQAYDKIAELMKPALARGDIKVIGATTLQESQNLIKDPALNRRFTRIIVDELSPGQTKEILRQMSDSLVDHYGHIITIDDRVIDEVIHVADEYKTIGSHRPDNAITLLDRSMADVIIDRYALMNRAKLNDDQACLHALNITPQVFLSRKQMKRTAMKLMTGNSEKTVADIEELKRNLSVIKGQDEVVDYIVDALQRDSLNLFPRRKPLTMLFAGESGVGKSEVAKMIAENLTNVKPIILNMTEFHSDASINRIIGAPAGYVGSESKAELPFDILESNPYQVILLDEFEKSDKAVQRLFMSAFDEGYIKTAKGKSIDFSKSIIIATTNAGYTTKRGSFGFAVNDEGVREGTLTDMADYFDIELLNRFTKILRFHPITERLFREILVDTYERTVKTIKEGNHAYGWLEDTMPEEEVHRLVKENYHRDSGARPVTRAVQRYIEDVVLARQEK